MRNIRKEFNEYVAERWWRWHALLFSAGMAIGIMIGFLLKVKQ